MIFFIDVVIGTGGTNAKSMHIKLPKFTLIGATTRAGMLTAPLRDRFGIVSRMDYYNEQELKTIIMNSARKLNVPIDAEGAAELAGRSRGTPRLANRFLKRVRDFAQVTGDGHIDGEIARYTLDMLDVDRIGLDHIDRAILTTMIEKFAGGPVGTAAVATTIGEDQGTIEDVYEPYLVQIGFILRTQRGRVVSREAYEHLGIPFVEKNI